MPERVSKLARGRVACRCSLDPADPPAARPLLPLPGAAEARRDAGAGVRPSWTRSGIGSPRSGPRDYPERFVVYAESFIDSIVGPFRRTLYTMAAAVGAAAADRVHQRRQHAAQPRRRPRAGDGRARRARRQPDPPGAAAAGREPAAGARRRGDRLPVLAARDHGDRRADPRRADPARGQDPAEHAGAALQPRRRGDHGPDLRAGAGAADGAASD